MRTRCPRASSPRLRGPADFGKPAEVITHRVDVADFTASSGPRWQAHRSQISETAFFLTMPDDMFGRAFGTEWYIADGPAAPRVARRRCSNPSADAGDARILHPHRLHAADHLRPGSSALTGLLRTLGLRRDALVTTEGRLTPPRATGWAATGRALASTFAEVQSHVPVPLVQRACSRRGARRCRRCRELRRRVVRGPGQGGELLHRAGDGHARRLLRRPTGAPAPVGADDVLGAELTPFFGMTDPTTGRRAAVGDRRSRRSPPSTTRS